MQLPRVREFGLTGLYELSGAEILWVGGRKAGVLVQMPEPDGRTYFLGRRRWRHLLHRPTLGWALSESLLHQLVLRDVGWVRLELFDSRRGWLSWEAPTGEFFEDEAVRIHHPPFEPQRLLPIGLWIFVDPLTLERELLRWPTPSKARRRPA